MKNKNKLLRAEADKLWREVVIKKYGDKCEVCGKPAIHCHHFYPKGLFSHLRFDIENGVPLCFHCHFSRHHKGDPTVNETIIEKRGKEWYNKLKEKAQEKHRSYQTTGYYYDIIEGLQEKLKENTPR